MTRQQARFNHPEGRWIYNLQSLDRANKIMKVQLEVEVQYCHNCQEHAFCSQHDETKYLFHYDKIRESLLQKIPATDALIYRRMDPPKHYQKMVNPKETKYYDVRREEEVYFPRLGSFEVYVDGVLIFSKLKANIWPNYQSVAETIAEMYKLKLEGKQIYMFEVGYNKDVKEGERIRQKSASFRKRQLQQGKTIQRQKGEPALNSIEFDQYQKTINSSIMRTTDYQNLSPNARYANGSSPEGIGEDGNRMAVSTDIKNLPNSVKNYHQIYSSALYELRQQARRDRKKEKRREKDQKYVNSDKLVVPGAEYLEPLLPGRKSKGKRNKKPIKQAILYEHEGEYAPIIPKKKSTVKSMEKQVDEELNLPDIVNPNDYDIEQKERLYQKYDNPHVDENKIKQHKEKDLDAVNKEEQNQMEKIDFLNEKLEMPKIKEAAKEMKVIEENPKEETTPPLPPIKTIDQSKAHPEEKKKTESRKIKTPNTPRSALNKSKPSEKHSKHESQRYINDFESDSQHSPVQPKPRRQLLDSIDGKTKSNQAIYSKKEEIGVQMDSPLRSEKHKSDHQKTEGEKELEKEKRLNKFSLRQVYDVSMNFNRKLEELKKSDKKISTDEEFRKPLSKNKVVEKVVNETIESRVERNQKSPQLETSELERIYRTLPNKMNVDTPEMTKSRKMLELKLAEAKERSIERNKSAVSIKQMEKSARSKKGSQTDLKSNKSVDQITHIADLKQSKSQELLVDRENIKKLVINEQKLNELPKSKEELEKLEAEKKQSKAKIEQAPQEEHQTSQKVEMNSEANHEATKMETTTHQTEKKSEHLQMNQPKQDQHHEQKPLKEESKDKEAPKIEEPKAQQKESLLKNKIFKPEYTEFAVQTESRSQIAIQTQESSYVPKEQRKLNIHPEKIEQKINDEVEEERSSEVMSQKIPNVDEIRLNMHKIEQKPEQYAPDVDEKVNKKEPPVQKQDRGAQTIPEERNEIVPASPQKDEKTSQIDKRVEPAVLSTTNSTPGVNVSVKIGEINVKMDMTVVSGRKKQKQAEPQEEDYEFQEEEVPEETEEVPANNSKYSNQQTNISPKKEEKKEEKKERKPIIKPEFPSLKLQPNRDGIINPFYDYYDYSGNKITKIDGNSLWHCIKFDEPLPSKGRYSFGMQVLSSEINCIEIGIMPHEFTPVQNKICDKAIGFHFANGKIHDTNARSKKTTVWRNVCPPAKKGTTGVIELQVDVDAQVMHWRVNGRKIAESILTDYLKIRRCAAYVSMVHQNDSVRINAEPVMSKDRDREASPYKEDRNQSPAKQQLHLSKTNLNESTINLRESMLERDHSKVPASEVKPSQGGDLRTSTLPANQAELINQTSLPNSPEKSSSLNKTMNSAEKQKKGVPRIQLHLLKDKIINPYYGFYQQQGDKLTKIRGDGLWHLIKCDEILPNTGRYSFAINVVSSELNCVEVGIMPQDFQPVQNKICDKSIGFHLANGKIHDTKGDKGKKTTSWRPVMEPFLKGNSAVIELFVDADAQIIRWKMNGNVFAESVLTDYLKNKRCVAYISTVHKNDTVLLNPEPIPVKNLSPTRSQSISPRKDLSISPSRSKSIGKIVKNRSPGKSQAKSMSIQPKKELSSELQKEIKPEPKKDVQPSPKKETQPLPQSKPQTKPVSKQNTNEASKDAKRQEPKEAVSTAKEPAKQTPKEGTKELIKQSSKEAIKEPLKEGSNQVKPVPSAPQQGKKPSAVPQQSEVDKSKTQQTKPAPHQAPKQMKPSSQQAKPSTENSKPAPSEAKLVPQQGPKQSKPIPQQAPKEAISPAAEAPKQQKEAKTSIVSPKIQPVKESTKQATKDAAKDEQKLISKQSNPSSELPIQSQKQISKESSKQTSKQIVQQSALPKEATKDASKEISQTPVESSKQVRQQNAVQKESPKEAKQKEPKEIPKQVSNEASKPANQELNQQNKKQILSSPSVKDLKSEATPSKPTPNQQEQSQLNRTQSPQRRELSSTKVRQSIPRITLHLERDRILNPFIDNFEIAGNKLIKVKGDGIWHTLKFAEVLPQTGRYSLGLNIARSSLNCVEIGIMPQEFASVENKICEKGIGFHYANGKIHDTKGVKDKKTTSWRPVCEPAAKGVGAIVEIFVDADAQIIRWKMNGKVFAESTLTNYLKSKRCVAYISFVHKEDIIELNPEPIKSKPKREGSPSPKKEEASPSKPPASNQPQPPQKTQTPAADKTAPPPAPETSVSP